MAKSRYRAIKAYKNEEFLSSLDAREIRIQAEYLEPESRFENFDVKDTVVFFGSARIQSRRSAQRALKIARERRRGIAAAEKALALSRYYEEARSLAYRLTEWSKNLDEDGRRFVVCTGGGPGIMEAANRGASEAKGLNVGLNISLPFEQDPNPYITRHLSFDFHYFFMRKFWFLYLAKAMIVFPGGFGTLDEMFEVLTLDQTGKLTKPVPVVLFGSEYWDKVLDLEALVEFGTINQEDFDAIFRTESVDEAFEFITAELLENALGAPGGVI